MKIRRDIVQGTDEWFKCRELRLSASKAQAIASNGAGLKTLVVELLTEKYSQVKKAHFSNEETDRGKELEPIARNIYELETGNTVEEVGLIEFGEYVSISPDGLTEDGGVEIKCLNDTNHVKAILFGVTAVEKKYIWQVQMSLLLTKRKWWDLVLFNPNLKDSLLVFRITSDKKMQDEIKKGLENGVKLIKKFNKKLKTTKNN